MTYGTIKVDTVTFTNAGVDKSVTLSGLVQNPVFSGNVTVTGTLSGVTVTGTTANFTSGNFTNISGGTHTITSGVFAAGSAASPSITFTGDLNTGIYSPGADQVAISTGGSGRLFVDASGNIGVGTTTAPPAGHIARFSSFVFAPGFTVNTSGDTGIYSTIANTLQFQTNGSEKVRITSAGLVGIGTSSPSELFQCQGNARFDKGGNRWITIDAGTNATYDSRIDASHTLIFRSYTAAGGTPPSMVFDTSGRLGIGTTSPGAPLEVIGTAGTISARATTGVSSQAIQIYNNGTDSYIDSTAYGAGSGGGIVFRRNGSGEMGRWDTSGRLLVGTSSSPSAGNGQYAKIAVQGNTATNSGEAFLSLQRGEAATAIASGVGIGQINFGDSSGNSFAFIQCLADANAGSGDYPGRLVFSTTADGASSPTERTRLDSNGRLVNFAATAGIGSRSATGAGTAEWLFAGNHSATNTAAGTGTNVFLVYTNGNVVNTNGSYTTLSDRKLKENIVDAGSQWDDLKAIQIRNWNFKAETGHETHRQIGPIAQELETVCPGLVFETPDRDADGNETGDVTKGVNQSVLYMKAVKALQEAMERIEQLETSNADLLARVTALESA